VRVDADVDVVAHRAANRLHARDRALEHLAIGHLLRAGRLGSDLESGVAVLLDDLERTLGHLLRRAAAGVLVDAHFVARLAAEQLPDGHTERLALDVPERVLDPGDGRVGDNAAREAGRVVHELPEELDIARVAADQP